MEERGKSLKKYYNKLLLLLSLWWIVNILNFLCVWCISLSTVQTYTQTHVNKWSKNLNNRQQKKILKK